MKRGALIAAIVAIALVVAGGAYAWFGMPWLRVASSLATVQIPAGSFDMGADSQTHAMEAIPKRRITIKAFKLAVNDVTFDQYDAFAKATGRALPSDSGWGRGARPVINVSWDDTQAFIAWLNKNAGRHFRLPTDSEWEYAARAGATTDYFWGDALDSARANTAVDGGADTFSGPSPVGAFPANAFGLRDITGNVWQRVADCWHARYGDEPTDGRAYLGGTCHGRIARGGSWFSTAEDARVTARLSADDHFAGSALGFRLAED